jgi:hypothetical protein
LFFLSSSSHFFRLLFLPFHFFLLFQSSFLIIRTIPFLFLPLQSPDLHNCVSEWPMSRVRVMIDGFRVGNCIYWSPLQLVTTLYRSASHKA